MASGLGLRGRKRYLLYSIRKARMKQFIDPNHPFFAKAWVRWVTALVPVVWAFAEFVAGNTGWGMISAALGALAFWALIVRGPDAPAAPDDDRPQD